MLEIATSSRGFAMDATNVSGRAGRWSAGHWKTAAFGWIGVGILAVVVGGAVGAREMKPWAIAAIIMVAVFGLFAALSLIMMQQMGFGLAVAVLIDATVVRAVLVPATMKLLGEWNWYLPEWLDWVPSLAPEGEPTATKTTPPRPLPTG
jgi:MMPL family